LAAGVANARGIDSVPKNSRILVISNLKDRILFVETGKSMEDEKTPNARWKEVISPVDIPGTLVGSFKAQNKYSGFNLFSSNEMIPRNVLDTFEITSEGIKKLISDYDLPEFNYVLVIGAGEIELGGKNSTPLILPGITGMGVATGIATGIGGVIGTAIGRKMSQEKRHNSSGFIFHRELRTENKVKGKPRFGKKDIRTITAHIPLKIFIFDSNFKRIARPVVSYQRFPVSVTWAGKEFDYVSLNDIGSMSYTINKFLNTAITKVSVKMGLTPTSYSDIVGTPNKKYSLPGESVDDSQIISGPHDFKVRVKAINDEEAKEIYLNSQKDKCGIRGKMKVMKIEAKFRSITKRWVWGRYFCISR